MYDFLSMFKFYLLSTVLICGCKGLSECIDSSEVCIFSPLVCKLKNSFHNYLCMYLNKYKGGYNYATSILVAVFRLPFCP